MLRDTVVAYSRPERYRVRVAIAPFGRRNTRTNLKPAGSGRHRNSPEKEAEATADDHELTSYLAALAPEATPESTGSGKRFGEAQVHQLRLNPIASEQLSELAEHRGTSPQALAQEWILERLGWESQAMPPARGTAGSNRMSGTL